MNWQESKKSLIKEHNLPWYLIEEIRDCSIKVGITKIALIGGLVRDSLISSVGSNSLKIFKDIDIITEGSASILADYLQSKINKDRITKIVYYPSYDTVELCIDGFPIDIASARKEIYEYPGANPSVYPSSIKSDLSRRDFSINAIAIELNNLSIIDTQNGQIDLSNRKVRLLHKKSISDDPTRIIRAARYVSRLSFELERSSQKQIESTLNSWPWVRQTEGKKELIPAGLSSRLCTEMRLLFSEKKWDSALVTLQRLRGLTLIDKELQEDVNLKEKLYIAEKLKTSKLLALIIACKDPYNVSLVLDLKEKEVLLIKECLSVQKHMSDIKLNNEYSEWKPSCWTANIESTNYKKEAIALAICAQKDLWEILFKWYQVWSNVKPSINGDELIKRGWKPGPQLGEELKRLRDNELDKESNL